MIYLTHESDLKGSRWSSVDDVDQVFDFFVVDFDVSDLNFDLGFLLQLLDPGVQLLYSPDNNSKMRKFKGSIVC